MKKSRIVLASLFFFLSMGNAYAVVFVGTLQKNPEDMYSTCMQGETHTLDSNYNNETVSVKSEMVNLEGFEGSQVIAFGEEEFVECRIVRITAIYKTSADERGIVAGTIKNTLPDVQSAKHAELSIVLTNTSNGDAKTYKASFGENFYFDNLENGTYELEFIGGEGQLNKVSVTVSEDSPLQIQNFDISGGDNVPLMDNIGFALTFMLIVSVMRSKFKVSECVEDIS